MPSRRCSPSSPGSTPSAAAGAIDELARAGIVAPDSLAFVHPIVRNAIYEDIGARQRAQMHGVAAELLAESGALAEQSAAHLLRADPRGSREAVAMLRDAARTARERGSPAAAADYLDRALAEPPEEAERAPILLELGSAQARAGRPEALQNLQLAAAPPAASPVRLAATIELGQVLAYANRIEDAAEASQELLADLATEDERRIVEMLLLILAESDVAGRSSAGELLAGARAVVERLGERAPLGLTAIVAVEHAMVDGPAARAAELAERALAGGRILAEQGPESPHGLSAATALTIAGRHESAERHLRTIIDAAARRGSQRSYAFAAATRAWARSRGGDLDGAESDAHACLGLASDPGWELFVPLAQSALIEVALARGEDARSGGGARRSPARPLAVRIGLPAAPAGVARPAPAGPRGPRRRRGELRALRPMGAGLGRGERAPGSLARRAPPTSRSRAAIVGPQPGSPTMP